MRSVDDVDHTRRWFEYERAGSIADHVDDHRDDRFTVLLHAVIEVAGRAQQWLTADTVLALIDELPRPIADCVCAWALGNAADVDVVRLVGELTAAISERSPSGDDLRLIDRVVEECDGSLYVDAWREALGPAPSVAEVGRGTRNE